jgi:hypothetical protein
MSEQDYEVWESEWVSEQDYEVWDSESVSERTRL